MSRFEVQSFVEFAPHYFQYITKAHNEQVRVRACVYVCVCVYQCACVSVRVSVCACIPNRNSTQRAYILKLSDLKNKRWSPAACLILFLQKPTVLAKIVGVYRIGYRNSQTNTALKQDLLVIENLFYDRNVKQVRITLKQDLIVTGNLI